MRPLRVCHARSYTVGVGMFMCVCVVVRPILDASQPIPIFVGASAFTQEGSHTRQFVLLLCISTPASLWGACHTFHRKKG